MSGESAPKIRLVLCPKCRQLLQEHPDFDVYKCGGCGTTLQAKKRRSGTLNSESSACKTDAHPVSDDKHYSHGEQLAIPQESGLKVKATSSFSEESSSDGKEQIQNGEYSGEDVVRSKKNDMKEKATRSSSGKCSLDGNDFKNQIQNGECNGKEVVLSQKNDIREKAIRSSSGGCSLDENDQRGHIENGECNREQGVLPQENDLSEKATNISPGEHSLGGNNGREKIGNGECGREQGVLTDENNLREKEAISSSRGCSLDGIDSREQIENGECNGEQLVSSKKDGVREEAPRSSIGECSLDVNGGRGQVENGDCNGEQVFPHWENGSSEKIRCYLDKDDGRHQIQNVECNGEQLVLPRENGLMKQATSSPGRNQSRNVECMGEQLGSFSLSDEVAEEMDSHKFSDIRRHKRVSNKGFSKELANSEIKGSSKSVAENLVEKANDSKLELAREEPSNENMPEKGAEEELIWAVGKDVNNDKSALAGVKYEVDISGGSLEGAAGELNNENLSVKGEGHELISELGGKDANDAQPALAENPRSIQSTGAKSEADITISTSTAKGSSTENFVSEKGNIAQCKLEEGTQDQKKVHQSFDCVRSVDVDPTEVANTSTEFSGTLGELPKSPATRSLHAYDGSISSNDGVYEQFPSLDSFENSYTVVNDVLEGNSRKGKGLVDCYGDLETQHQSYFLGAKRHHVVRDRRWNPNQVLEYTRHGRSHGMRTRDDFSSNMPFHRSSSQSGYESGSPLSQTLDELYASSSFVSPDSCEDPDQEKMKLMRIVYKLQDQLNRTRYMSGETNGRSSMDVSYKGNHLSTYHSHDLLERRFHHGLDYPRCEGRCSHGSNWRRRHNYSQPYLSEPTCSTHLVDHPCYHCCPQEWQCSAELPPRVLYTHEDLCRYHPGPSCSSHHSLPSSPQWFMSPKIPGYDLETKSCDQIHRVAEMKNYLREKQNLNKRHYRPVAGGAPFVTCHKCFKLLQMPADFLLFKRVCHQLKCGACSEVLKFSLQNQSHIVSYGAPSTPGLQSSQLDEQNEMIIDNNLNSASHANNDHSSHADPVSYSDDFGHSISKSYSSEGDPVSLTPLHPSHGNEDHKQSVFSNGNFEPITEENNIASRGPSEIAMHSSNVSGSEKLPPEIEGIRSQQKSSPLHQLMGYSSPSQVIRGVNSPLEYKETIFKVENDI
ncbi:uncharacterized protein LOC130940996 [Arachis stenosperma]|uniref:uncharacterized protein LOC130940996 n=1 Tax=Arachis stenosperma TaxID=217475 RepID=UPI0025ABC7C0|nr:uncharacterized protein LOC130940996 [Arachis stenosperma]XP_057725306.1 uncharacterized protein LOC130940996 [Arachis stenosperma]